MSHEQRKPRIHGGIGIYNIETHSGAIQEAQDHGRLRSVRLVLDKVEGKEEAGLEWYLLYLHFPVPLGPYQIKRASLFSGDCNEEVIRKLAPNEIVTKIESLELRPDVCFGNENLLIAAVLTEDERVIYKSPGFDLKKYMQEQAQEDNKNEHEK